LIFDEVMTGFRVDYRCAQGLYGIDPDLTCLGKIIGGGLPVGAYGGRRDIMEMIAPSGPIYQAGTLSGNPLAMAAGFTTLSLLQPSVYEELERKSARLAAGFTANAAEKGLASTINRVGSMICPFFTNQAVTNYEEAKTSDLALFNRYFANMLDLGVSVAPSQFEGMFVSAAHTDEDIDATIEAHREALKRL
jgi:glutamate-1-semialdehyde 2,1-aminomutase